MCAAPICCSWASVFSCSSRTIPCAAIWSKGATINHLGLSFYLPIVALVLAFLAERSIKADEDLVRSVDRLR
ncbi:MAG: DUF4293 family protein [Flavobacteriales bacterium]|nr:DUF4293 family protein [Flavobacteriales bacterium]